MTRHHYRVSLHSKAGMWEQYSGHVDVSATDDEDARWLAIEKLARGTFRDRGRDAWIITKVERRQCAMT